MSKGVKKRPDGKVRKRIRLKFDVRRIANWLMIPVITVIIVGIGVFIPAFLLRGKSDVKRLPSGYIDIGEIQPYGAAYQKTKQGITDAVADYADLTASHGCYIDVSGTYCRGTATCVDHFSQVNAGPCGGDFLYEFSEMLNENYGYEIPESWEVRDLNENNVLVGDLTYRGEGFVMDTTTGVPIVGRVEITSREEGVDPAVCFYEIVEMYNDYTGLNFVTESSETRMGDGYYARSIISSDNSFSLNISILCQDYYPIEGDELGEVYTVWYITLDISDIENDIEFNSSVYI